MGLNIFTFTGNLGKDAEQKFLPNGDSIVSMSVPVTSGFGEKQKTAWIRCTLFGKRGESVMPYLLKGQLVGITGEFSLNEWTDKDGMKRSMPEVRISDLQLLGKANKEATHEQPAQKQTPQRNAQGAPPSSFSDMDDDIPFRHYGSGAAWRVI